MSEGGQNSSHLPSCTVRPALSRARIGPKGTVTIAFLAAYSTKSLFTAPPLPQPAEPFSTFRILQLCRHNVALHRREISMCSVPLFPVFGFLIIGLGIFGLVVSLNPRCEYPERRLVAPIVKMLLLSSVGLFLLTMGGTNSCSGTCPKDPIQLPCPALMVLCLALLFVLIQVIRFFVSPYYWRRRLSSWASHNRFALLDFGKLHSGSGTGTCFRVVLRDASGKERKAEATFAGNIGFNLNHVDIVWLD